MRRAYLTICVLFLSLSAPAAPVLADQVVVPVLAPITGFLALEGGAQRNGAILAAEHASKRHNIKFQADVQDTTTAPDVAVSALKRTLKNGKPPGVLGPILGSQMLALLPIADQEGLPILTISGTAKLTEFGSVNVFRFFPGDSVVKAAHALFATEQVGMKRPAILFQTTAYGQSGRSVLVENLNRLGVTPVYEEGLSPASKDLSAAIAKAASAGADGLLLHLHAGPTALVIRQAHELGLNLPIVAGSAMHQPTTAALLEPAMLKGVCAESGSAPAAEVDGPGKAFADSYRARFNTEPDAFALAEYDAVGMFAKAYAAGSNSAATMRAWLSKNPYQGIAMSYVSNGKGDMAHSAVIVCYDGVSHNARVARRFKDGAWVN